MTTHFAWKHDCKCGVFCPEQWATGIFSSEEEAFKAFREYVGQKHVCESIQDEFYLVNVSWYGEKKRPMDISDCPNCSWGFLKLDREHWYECDECGYRVFHN